jgi:hypothetical protein
MNLDNQLRLIFSGTKFHMNKWSPPAEGSGGPEACVHFDNSGNDFKHDTMSTYTNTRNFLGASIWTHVVDHITELKGSTKSPIEYMNIL